MAKYEMSEKVLGFSITHPPPPTWKKRVQRIVVPVRVEVIQNNKERNVWAPK